jgi:hypothetical protein
MATPRGRAQIDPASIHRLSQRFAEVFITLDAGDDLFSPDVFFDLNVPVWRFQLQGPQAFQAQIRSINKGDVRINVLRTVPTSQDL